MTEFWRIHPSLRNRSEPIGSGDVPTCAFERAEEGHPAGGVRYVCSSCKRPWVVYGAGTPPEDRPCPQLAQGDGPPPISDRREERRRRRGIRGPLCDAIRGRSCVFCPRPSDPAHVESVGSGRADFARIDGRWVGRVANLCRIHHEQFDEYRLEGSLSREVVEEAARAAGDVWMEGRGIDPESPVHPYEQLRERTEEG